MNLLSRLRTEGVLLLHHDYRTGTFQDFSGNGNHGIPTSGVKISKSGIKLSTSVDQITIADNPALRTLEASWILFGDFRSQTTTERLISKRDAGGKHVEWYTSSTSLILAGDGPIYTIATDIKQKRYVAANFKETESAESFVDGISIGNYSGTMSITENDAPILVGNLRPLASQPIKSRIDAVIITSRQLTAPEHAELYAELIAGVPDSRQVITEIDSSLVRSATHIGPGSMVTTADITSGRVGGTPFTVDSGTFSVDIDTMNGRPTKVLSCIADGLVWAKFGELRNNDAEAAYGTYEICLNRDTLGNFRLLWQSSVIGNYFASGQTGYMMSLNPSEAVYMQRNGGGVTTISYSANGVVTPGVYECYKITRTPAGEFSVYLNGTLIAMISGTNPFTDNTYNTGKYINIAMVAGDKIALAHLDGTPLFSKYLGVV